MVDWDGEGYEQISDLQRWLAGRALAAMELQGDERVRRMRANRWSAHNMIPCVAVCL